MNADLLSQIRILPIDKIVPFEQLPNIDPDSSLSDCHLVRDPFLVAPLEDGTYVLLDNTDTFAELVYCGLTQLPVQIAGCNQIVLSSPRLGLHAFSVTDLTRLTSTHPEHIIIADQPDQSVDPPHMAINCAFSDSPPVRLILRRHQPHGCPDSLRLLFDAIQASGGYQAEFRLGSITPGLMRRRDYSCLLSLPHPTFEDIAYAAHSQQCYPLRTVHAATGVRALQIDLSVAVLTSDLPLGEIEAYLRDLIIYRHQQSRTTTYEGRIYLFNR
jgi:hypothetical protein